MAVYLGGQISSEKVVVKDFTADTKTKCVGGGGQKVGVDDVANNRIQKEREEGREENVGILFGLVELSNECGW